MQISRFPKCKSIALVVSRLYLLLAILQGLGTLVFMLQAESEEATHRLLGLSYTRQIIVLFFLIFSLVFTALFVEIWVNPTRFQKRMGFLIRFLNKPKAWGFTLLLLGGVFLLGSYFLTLLPDVCEPFTQGLFSRLLPLVIWITGLSAQTLIALLVIRYGSDLLNFKPGCTVFYLTCLILGGMFLTWSLVIQDALAVESQITGWNIMGAPIIEIQLLIAWGAGLVMFMVSAIVNKNLDSSSWLTKLKPKKSDFIIALLIGLVTIVLWQSIPITPNWFLSKPTYPNFEGYPTSDALSYDLVAQTALIGEGYLFFNYPVIKRPLHALYMTVLRLMGGQNYTVVMFLQILVLALIPVLIYYFTKNLHNQISGVTAAVIIMLREANSVAISGIITTSHVKTIMIDLPVVLTNVIFILTTLKMLQELKERRLLALISGAALGFSTLIRPESFVFLIPLIVIMGLLLFPQKQYSLWMKQSLLLFLGITLVIVPWIWRNWKITGIIYFNSPYIRYNLIEQRFRSIATLTPDTAKDTIKSRKPTRTPNVSTEIAPSTTPQVASPVNTPMPPTPSTSVEEQARKPVEQAISFIIKNPKQLVGFILAHYMNSQLQTILIMPSSFRAMDSFAGFIGHRSLSKLWQECCSLSNYVRRMPYWHKWDNKFPSQSIIPLIINSIILATGIHVAWKRHRLIGIVPLLYCVTYLLFNAIFRNSGGRYVLPVDWIVVVYFSIGLIHISICLISYITSSNIAERFIVPKNQSKTLPKSENLLRSPKFYATLIGVSLIAWALPLVETSFPKIYTETRKQEMLNTLYQSELLSDSQHQDLQTFAAQGGLVFAGRALYPQYYRANVGGIGDRSSPQSPKPYDRLIFYLIGQYNSTMLMPIREKPSYFPNASDVLVFMCPQEDVFAVIVFNASEFPQAIWMNASYPSDLICPIPLPEMK